MKKIGILTFSTADNYGAMLQSYALKYTLKRLGNIAGIINFYYPKKLRMNQFFYHYKPSVSWFVKRIFKLFFRPVIWYYGKHCFRPFRQRYLEDTPRVYHKDLPKLCDDYDLFITGSDQVFNCRITEYDADFFLAFSKNPEKNASYSASFGLGLDQFSKEEQNFIQKNLPNLGHISVREKQGQDIVSALSPNQQAHVHIDPTFLFTKKDWQDIAVAPRISKKYALLYLMRKDNAFKQFAKKTARSKGWELITISSQADINSVFPRFHAIPTVQEWVGLFLNAQYVFTTSFHGLAFSINFNKPFLTGFSDNSARLNNLLEVTGLQHRRFNIQNPQLYEHEDWSKVNEKLESERQKAFDYLKLLTK